jgi:division protein CdvB (Snf7/Vps24/ESCRT-III family)
MFSAFTDSKPAKQPTPKEVIRGTNKSLNNSKRDIDREIRNINRQEKKLETDIKKLANEGQINSAKIMAKELIRVRQQREQLLKTKLTISQVKAKTESASANLAVTSAMTGATRAMKTVNNINSMEKMSSTFREFEKQKMTMEMQDELLDDLLEDSSEMEEAEEVIGEVLDEINLELAKDLEYNSQEVIKAGRIQKERLNISEEKPNTNNRERDLESRMRDLAM